MKGTRKLNTDQLIIRLSKEIHELTKPKCAQCVIPFYCCRKARHWCQQAKDYAQIEYNIDLSNLWKDDQETPFLHEDDKGIYSCVVPLHLKPICTMHICEENLCGKKFDLEFNERYFRLRNLLSYLIFRKTRNNPNSKIKVKRIT